MSNLITGGAGFIGSNFADHLLAAEGQVHILDNLSRPGSERNLNWLRDRHPQLSFSQVDVRNYEDLEADLRMHGPFNRIFHFAAQVAVTTSVSDPREDFAINAGGTLNLLEAIRSLNMDPILLFASTNKVYGGLEQVKVVEEDTRYRFEELPQGVPEDIGLDFHSPYGCSKGCADQYVRDFHRIYGLRTVVFRNSCIYGPRQFGVEDQGWLAWFVIAAILDHPITIFGNGKQVRDVLYVEDLIRAMELATMAIDKTQGQIYNIGGGPGMSLSIWEEFSPILEDLLGRSLEVRYGDWRPGDQPVYVSDISKARRDFSWEPTVTPTKGIEKLYLWVKGHEALIREVV